MAFILHVHALEAKNLPSSDQNGLSDPFLKIRLGGEKQKSQVCKKTTNPVWAEEFSFSVKDAKEKFQVEVWDYDRLSRNDLLCKRPFDLAEIEKAGNMSGWFDLQDPKTDKVLIGKAIHLTFVVERDVKNFKPKDQAYLAARKKQIADVESKEVKEVKAEVKAEAEDAFTLFVGSWNVGNKPPPDDLSAWIPARIDNDVVVIGAQECKYDARKGASSCEKDWIATLANHLGDKYFLVSDCHLWEIRLAVFALKKHEGHIGNVEASTEATGIGHVMGNKGGTVVTFSFHDLTLCFVNTHLAAHQDKVERRNADVAEVIKGIKLGHKGKYDILNQYHHVFWMGDLNYRLDYGDQGDAKKPSEEQFNKMVKMVDDKKFAELFQHDQLFKQMAEKKVFVGFQEGKCNFPPTFKVLRNENLVYSEKRSPAWCDRILWKSMPGFEDDVKQQEFNAAIKIMSSDHKPVYGVFTIRKFHLPGGLDHAKGPATLTVTGLKGKNLAALDVGGTSDPFVQFRSPVIVHNLVETPVIKKNINPEWQDKQIPKIPLLVNDEKRLAKSFLFIRVFDHDRGSKNDLIGGAILPLAGVCSGRPVPFSLQLTQFGLPSGTIEGTLHLEWGKKA